MSEDAERVGIAVFASSFPVVHIADAAVERRPKDFVAFAAILSQDRGEFGVSVFFAPSE